MAHEMDSLINMQQCRELRDSIKRRVNEIDDIPQLVTISNTVRHISKIKDTKFLISIETLAKNLVD